MSKGYQPVAKVNILGVGVSAINMEDAIDIVDGWIRSRESNYICVTGVHGVMESQGDLHDEPTKRLSEILVNTGFTVAIQQRAGVKLGTLYASRPKEQPT